MYKNLLSWFTLALLLPSCNGNAPHISVVCEENHVGNCIVKWEIIPTIQGDVKIYASTNPDSIPEDIPVATANIADLKTTIVTSDPTRRYYFSMVFDNKYRIKVASRNVIIPGIQNFRDLGGYSSYITKRTTRWGMLYRSAEMHNLSYIAQQELKNIGIKTIVDLRSPSEIQQQQLPDGFNIVHIPIATGNVEKLLREIRHERLKGDSVYKIVKQINRDLIYKYTKEYRQMFDILLDSENYPIVIHCPSGKERTGIASALVLAVLGVDDDLIMDDYRLSNDYFSIPSVSDAYHLPVRTQEAITTLFSAREDFLNAAKEEAERRYGDVSTYLEEGIGLSKYDIKRLRNILLTDNFL